MNSYNWGDGRWILTFIVGSKYCTVAAAYAAAEEVFESVLAWAREVDPDGSVTPFVVLSETYVPSSVFDWYLENELSQVQVNA